MDPERQHAATTRARAHWRVAVGIIAVIGTLYGALILLIAYDKPFLGRTVVPGLSLAILLASLVTVAAWVLTLIYVRWANAHDALTRRL